MEIKRNLYLNRLIKRRMNGMPKVITGIRRCGKSYLLFQLYYDYLLSQGVPPTHILGIALDNAKYANLRDAGKLYSFIEAWVEQQRTEGHEKDELYVFLDEIQYAPDFSEVINGLSYIRNLDVYVTGSNSKFLSTDILTEFRGRGDEVRVFPLSFAEYAPAFEERQDGRGERGGINRTWQEYYTYGGLPVILSHEDDEMKIDYLDSLFRKVYISDIQERNKLRDSRTMDILLNILSSSMGSLTNPSKLEKMFLTSGHSLARTTIKQYLDYCMDAFLIEKAERYNVKGKKYMETPSKYYFTDIGLRNARLNFRQQEENHIMENIIFNELQVRGFRVDVGVVGITETGANGKRQYKQLEIDFVANRGSRRYYLQSVYELSTNEKTTQEMRPLLKVSDSFKKIVVVKDDIKTKRDEHGIVTMGIWDFLLNQNSLDEEAARFFS